MRNILCQRVIDAPDLKVGDKIRVVINGNTYEPRVRGFSKNAKGLLFVKFRIDWDEGPIDYDWNVTLVEKVELDA